MNKQSLSKTERSPAPRACLNGSKKTLATWKNQLEKALVSLLKDQKLPKKLYNAANYALFPGGKYFRPILLLGTLEALGYKIEKGLYPAIALECIHNYSLIHDDLPCMDDDDFRRSRPSLHKAFPEWLALLAGDFLLTFAFEILVAAPKLSSEQKIALSLSLAKHIGGAGMIAGQVADLELVKQKATLKQLQYLHLHKTADLMIAAVEFACIIARLPKNQWKKWQKFAKNLGLAYQLFDDLEDVKAKNGTNIVPLLGKRATLVNAQTLLHSAIALLPPSAGVLKALCLRKLGSCPKEKKFQNF